VRCWVRKELAPETNISWNVSGHVATLGLDDRESRQGSTTELFAHLRGTLKEAGVQVEHITRVSLTAGRATEEEGHLTVSDGLLGQIIIDD
jgi:hypothetical protein